MRSTIMATPPFTVSAKAISLVSDISIRLTRLTIGGSPPSPMLRRVNMIRSIQSSLAIEKNSLTVSQVTDVIDGKRVLGNAREIQEVKNAFDCYDKLLDINPYDMDDLLSVHGTMMRYLLDDAGRFRTGGVGVFAGKELIHMAPPSDLVPALMTDLFDWLRKSEDHPLIKSCVFHYEFEFIHPFSDGNGRIGRLWLTAIMASWIPEMAWVPVESVVRERQSEYYSAIATSITAADSGPFIDFMLEAICDALDGVAKSSGIHATALNPTENHLLGMIRSGTYANASMAAEALSVSERTIFRALKSLKEKGLIVREGTDKTGVWRAT